MRLEEPQNPRMVYASAHFPKASGHSIDNPLATKTMLQIVCMIDRPHRNATTMVIDQREAYFSQQMDWL